MLKEKTQSSFGKAFLSKKRFVLKEKPLERFLVKVFIEDKKVVSQGFFSISLRSLSG